MSDFRPSLLRWLLLPELAALALLCFASGPACLGEEGHDDDPPVVEVPALETPAPPVWKGFTLPRYEPEYWNDGSADRQYCQMAGTIVSKTRQDNNNCYNYATNVDGTQQASSAFAQPGLGVEGRPVYGTLGGDTLRAAAVADGLEYVGDFYPSSATAGKAVVVLLISDTGFHWARQDSNGFWSHKNGRAPASNVDMAGRQIADPRAADWGYFRFYGYFLVDSGGEAQGQGREQIGGMAYPANICM